MVEELLQPASQQLSACVAAKKGLRQAIRKARATAIAEAEQQQVQPKQWTKTTNHLCDTDPDITKAKDTVLTCEQQLTTIVLDHDHVRRWSEKWSAVDAKSKIRVIDFDRTVTVGSKYPLFRGYNPYNELPIPICWARTGAFKDDHVLLFGDLLRTSQKQPDGMPSLERLCSERLSQYFHGDEKDLSFVLGMNCCFS